MDKICVEGCQVLTHEGLRVCDIHIKSGKISAITNEPCSKEKNTQMIDGQGKILIPGMIDQHVHIREPGGPEHENFETGTSAAAVGGVTTVLEMPVSDLPVTSAKQLLRRRTLATHKAYVDFGFYGGVGVGSIDRIQEQVDAGAVAFKTFMCRPDPHRERELAGLWAENDQDLEAVFRGVARTGLPLAVHAEDGAMIRSYEREGLQGVNGRPPETEISAVKRACCIAGKTGVRLVLCHLSTFEAVEIACEYKKRGADIFIECAPHHLFLCQEEIAGFETYAKVKPPVRSRKNVDRLWSLIDGVDAIASDHAPYDPELKKLDMAIAPYGIPGLELTLRLLIDAVLHKRLALSKMVSLTSLMPASIFGIQKKGVIKVGADADLVMIDPKATHKIDTEKMYSKSGRSASMYQGKKLHGDIDMVMARGSIVAWLGKVTGKKGFGRNMTG